MKIAKVRRHFFGMKTKDRLARLPRLLSSEYDPRLLDGDTIRLMNKTHVRSPEGIRVLLRRNQVETVDELIDLLPHNYKRRDVRQRVYLWLQHLFGVTDYEPSVRPFLRRLKAEGRLASDRTRVYERRYRP